MSGKRCVLVDVAEVMVQHPASAGIRPTAFCCCLSPLRGRTRSFGEDPRERVAMAQRP